MGVVPAGSPMGELAADPAGPMSSPWKCVRAISDELESAWDRTGALGDRASIERSDAEPEPHLLELMWWDTVEDDASRSPMCSPGTSLAEW